VQSADLKQSEISRFEMYLVDNFPISSAMSYAIGRYVQDHFAERAEPKANLVCIESSSRR
jgi:hypothetical protein